MGNRTGKAATAVEAQEAHAFIRNFLLNYFGADIGAKIQILYGGSVKASNVTEYISCPDIDGAFGWWCDLISKDFLELCIKK